LTFFDPLYRWLASLGYPHPLHPPWTHVTIGLTVGAFLFGWGARVLGRPDLAPSARHCLVVAWIMFFPTVLLGFMDWQHFYHGVWMRPIIVKICLAAFLLVVLSAGLVLIYLGRGESRFLLMIYTLGFLSVTALGYFGGEIVYGGAAAAPGAATEEASVQAGKKVFDQHCQACHPGGGNVVLPQYPLRGSDELDNFPKFLAFLRDPRLDNGAKGPMPDFPPQQLPDRQARELHQYLTKIFGKPGPGGGP
jgi:mono/diheme cytochrome c family protein